MSLCERCHAPLEAGRHHRALFHIRCGELHANQKAMERKAKRKANDKGQMTIAK